AKSRDVFHHSPREIASRSSQSFGAQLFPQPREKARRCKPGIRECLPEGRTLLWSCVFGNPFICSFTRTRKRICVIWCAISQHFDHCYSRRRRSSDDKKCLGAVWSEWKGLQVIAFHF